MTEHERATCSEDGIFRLQLLVTANIDLYYMAVVVAAYGGDIEEIRGASRAKMLYWTRACLLYYGLDAIYMHVFDVEPTVIKAAEQRLVELGFFPPVSLSSVMPNNDLPVDYNEKA